MRVSTTMATALTLAGLIGYGVSGGIALASDTTSETRAPGKNTVGTRQIIDESIKAKDMGKAVAAANSYTDGSVTALFNGNTIAQTLVVKLPWRGTLAVNATWQFGLNADEAAECSVTLNSSTFSTTFRNGAKSDDTGSAILDEAAAAVTAVFLPVPKGTHTLRLICRTTVGLATVRKRSLSAIYLPRGHSINATPAPDPRTSAREEAAAARADRN